jgi:hypothetical protein
MPFDSTPRSASSSSTTPPQSVAWHGCAQRRSRDRGCRHRDGPLHRQGQDHRPQTDVLTLDLRCPAWTGSRSFASSWAASDPRRHHELPTQPGSQQALEGAPERRGRGPRQTEFILLHRDLGPQLVSRSKPPHRPACAAIHRHSFDTRARPGRRGRRPAARPLRRGHHPSPAATGAARRPAPRRGIAPFQRILGLSAAARPPIVGGRPRLPQALLHRRLHRRQPRPSARSSQRLPANSRPSPSSSTSPPPSPKPSPTS